MNKNHYKFLLYILIALLLIAIGFFIGRKTTDEIVDKETIYVELPPIHDTICKPEVVKEIIPIDSADIIKTCIKNGKFYDLFPEKIKDSIIYITKHDTTIIIKDWATKRTYSQNLFDIDSIGKCNYTAVVQYNQMEMIGYEFIPVRKETNTTVKKNKYFSPYIGLGLSIDGYGLMEFGGFINDKWGASMSFNYNLNQSNNNPKYDLGLKVVRKF